MQKHQNVSDIFRNLIFSGEQETMKGTVNGHDGGLSGGLPHVSANHPPQLPSRRHTPFMQARLPFLGKTSHTRHGRASGP